MKSSTGTSLHKFIHNMFEDTTIVHAGFAFDKGANGTWSDDCAKAAKMLNRGMKIKIYRLPKNQNQENQIILLYATKQDKLL